MKRFVRMATHSLGGKAAGQTAWLWILLVTLLSLTAVDGRKGKLVELDEDTWSELLTGEWMIEFFAPWCPACKQLQPEWKQFAGWSQDLNIKIGSIDVTINPGLSGRFMVTALPTIYHVKDGIFRQYKGSRDTNSFVSYVEEKKWMDVEPISKWKSPNSIHMSIISYFFKISMALRSVHNRLVEDYGIPYWGSYVLFALATIIVGALLGLLIVCCIDLIFPTKAPEYLNELPPINDNVPASSSDNNSDIVEEESDESNDLRRRKKNEEVGSNSSAVKPTEGEAMSDGDEKKAK